MKWYSKNVKPEDVFKKELKEIWLNAKHGKPWVEEDHNCDHALFELLVTFEDLDKDRDNYVCNTPKVVSGVFFGCPASVRPITFSIVIDFLSSTSLGACADRLATLHVCRFSERSDRPLDRVEDAGDSCDVKPEC